jgi:phosphatidylserine/phosphatidylglycerophosphate/cardiolipin synthase-like enzyme
MGEILDQIYQTIGGDGGRYLGYSYGMSSGNALEKFLQTPDLWGHDPTDLSYIPAAGNLVAAVQDIISSAHSTVDITLLAPFPDGAFLDSIKSGLRAAAKNNPHIVVRILDGIPLGHTGGDFEDFMKKLDPPSTFPVYIGSMQSNMFSWNHSKLIVVDGTRVLTGGHNLWSHDYCEIAPIHDVSMVLSGPATLIAQNFLNFVWTNVASYSRQSGEPFSDQNARLWWNNKWYSNALPSVQAGKIKNDGNTTVLAVARLGDGIVIPSNDSNASYTARLAAARLAKKSIKLSQQSLDNTIAGNTVWATDYIRVLAQAVADRGVDLQIVISHSGAADGYSGEGIQATADRLHDAVAEASGKSGSELKKLLSQKVHLAPLHFYPNRKLTHDSEAWKWLLRDGSRAVPGNHAKVYIVDDEVFYVGSDNAYPIQHRTFGLQEFGFLVSSSSKLWEPIANYWESLWKYSDFAVHDWNLND